MKKYVWRRNREPVGEKWKRMDGFGNRNILRSILTQKVEKSVLSISETIGKIGRIRIGSIWMTFFEL
jgi:hypothetical protein